MKTIADRFDDFHDQQLNEFLDEPRQVDDDDEFENEEGSEEIDKANNRK